MFVEVKDMLINLEKVSNVGFLDFKKRVVFNFSHSIEIINKEKEWSTIADYKYYDGESEEDYHAKKEAIQKALIQAKFLEPYHCSHYWVNPKEISYINADVSKNRLIFNLNTSVDVQMKHGVSLGNDFVFWTFDNPEKFQEVSVDIIRKVKNV